jgi:EmrB/QacA subfamily drug resistance transporter
VWVNDNRIVAHDENTVERNGAGEVGVALGLAGFVGLNLHPNFLARILGKCKVRLMSEPDSPISKWWVMSAVAIGVFLSTIDGSIVNVALPTLARELRAPFAAVQWVVLAYLLVLVTLMMAAGRLADVYGKKRLYTAGFVIFTLGSVLCGMSFSVFALVLSRVVQGVGASLLMALGAAIVTEVFPARERGRAMGLIGLMVSIGLISGPTLGGLILGMFSWHAIFFVNLPLGTIGTALVIRVVPARKPAAHQSFDLKGAILLFVALCSLLLAATLGPRMSFQSPVIVLLAVVAVAGLIAFTRTELSVAHPLVDLTMFRNSTLATNVVTGLLVFVASSGLVFLLPFFLQNMQGRSPREAGVLMITAPLMVGLASPLSGWLSDRLGTRPLTIIGLGILIIAYGLLSTMSATTGTLGYVGRVLWIGLGMGTFQSPNNSAIMGSVPRERLGTASGLLSLTRTLGQTTGVALIGALWAGLVKLRDGTAEATTASVSAQLSALQWVSRAIAVLICVALALAIIDWYRSRGEHARQPGADEQHR